jgi:hypothetical protein
MRNGRLQQNNYASSSKQAEDRYEHLFVVQHMLNTMAANVSTNADNVWYVDSGASNHMTYHGEWFRDVKNLEKPGYVETGDDTAHPITHIGNEPLAMQDGKIKYLSNVIHVLNITKNLVSIGQMIEQGLQVRFNLDGCYVEDFKDKCRLVAKGKRLGRMFTLDVSMPEVEAAMFAQGAGVVADMDIWHKRISHVNEQQLKSM